MYCSSLTSDPPVKDLIVTICKLQGRSLLMCNCFVLSVKSMIRKMQSKAQLQQQLAGASTCLAVASHHTEYLYCQTTCVWLPGMQGLACR